MAGMNRRDKSLVVLGAFVFIAYRLMQHQFPTPNQEISESYQLAPAETVVYSFTPKEKVKVEVVVNVKQPGKATVFVLDDPNLAKLEAASEAGDYEYKDVYFVMRSYGSMGLVDTVTMRPENYHVVIANESADEIASIKLTLSTYPQ